MLGWVGMCGVSVSVGERMEGVFVDGSRTEQSRAEQSRAGEMKLPI